jgi:Fe-S-cluster containining protein
LYTTQIEPSNEMIKNTINGITIEVDKKNCIAYYKKSINEINPKFYDTIEGIIEKEQENSYLSTFVNSVGEIKEKYFSSSKEAQKYILSLFSKEINYYLNFKAQ